MPGINDDPKQVEEILGLVGEAGARSVGGVGLHLRGEVREIFFDWLRQYRPDLVPRYERLYAAGAYMARPERDRLAALARQGEADEWRRGRGISPKRPRGSAEMSRLSGSAEPSQTSLF
jgi:DNA repair photolyase